MARPPVEQGSRCVLFLVLAVAFHAGWIRLKPNNPRPAFGYFKIRDRERAMVALRHKHWCREAPGWSQFPRLEKEDERFDAVFNFSYGDLQPFFMLVNSTLVSDANWTRERVCANFGMRRVAVVAYFDRGVSWAGCVLIEDRLYCNRFGPRVRSVRLIGGYDEVVAMSSDTEKEIGHFQTDVLPGWLMIPVSVRRRSWIVTMAPAKAWVSEMASWVFEGRVISLGMGEYVFARVVYRLIPRPVSVDIVHGLIFLLRRFVGERFGVFAREPVMLALAQRFPGRRFIRNVGDAVGWLSQGSRMEWQIQDALRLGVGGVSMLTFISRASGNRAFAGMEGAQFSTLLWMRRGTAAAEFRPRRCDGAERWLLVTRHLGQFHVRLRAHNFDHYKSAPADRLPKQPLLDIGWLIASYLASRTSFPATP